MSDLNSLTTAQIEALLRERKESEKAEAEKAKGELAVLGADYLNHIVTTQPFARTEKTGRYGISVMTMPFTGDDGKAYTVSIHITDVVETEKGAAAVKAKKEAEEKAAKKKALLAEAGLTESDLADLAKQS